jgi:hypothetical protein
MKPCKAKGAGSGRERKREQGDAAYSVDKILTVLQCTGTLAASQSFSSQGDADGYYCKKQTENLGIRKSGRKGNHLFRYCKA